MADALQGLNLRSVGSAGLGFHVIKNDKTMLDLLAGANYTSENYTETNPNAPPPTRKLVHNFAGLTLGEELTHKLGSSTVLMQKLYFYPNLSDTGQYRGGVFFGTVAETSTWLGLAKPFCGISARDSPGGKKQKDPDFSTGPDVSIHP